MPRLEGKVAIVTGAGSGIGKAAVELFRSEGATVVGADIKGADVECDAGDDAQVHALIQSYDDPPAGPFDLVVAIESLAHSPDPGVSVRAARSHARRRSPAVG